MSHDNQAHRPAFEQDLAREPEPATDGELGADPDQSHDSAPERTEQPRRPEPPSHWQRARWAYSRRQAERVAQDVLAAFGSGRSAELDPRAERETLSSLARAAGWGGAR